MKLLLKTLLATLICLAIPTLLFAGKSAELSDDQLQELRNISEKIITSTHKSLDNKVNNRKRKYRLKFYSINKAQYFLESNFTIYRFLFGTPSYRIGVNPLLFEKSIPRDALEAIMAHELVHSEDYYNGSTIRTIIPIGFKVSNKRKRVQYERKTDLKTIMYGYGKGLISYKNFQYPLLDKEQLKRKKQEYLTPEEIELIESIKDEYPKLIQTWLNKKIPVDLKSFKAEIKAFKESN